MKRIVAFAAIGALSCGLVGCSSHKAADPASTPASSSTPVTTSASPSASLSSTATALAEATATHMWSDVAANHDTPQGVFKLYMELLMKEDYTGVCQQTVEPDFAQIEGFVEGCVEGMKGEISDAERRLLSSEAVGDAMNSQEMRVEKVSETSANVTVADTTMPTKLVGGKWYLDLLQAAASGHTP